MQKINEKIFNFMRSCSTNKLLISYSGAHGEKAGLSNQHTVVSEDGGDMTQTPEVSGNIGDGKAALDFPLKVRNLMGNKDLSVEGKRTTAKGMVEIVPAEELTTTLLGTVNAIPHTATGYEQIRSLKKGVMSQVKQLRVCQIRLLQLLQDKGMHKDLEIDLEGPKNTSVKLKAIHASAIVDTHRHGMAHAVQTDNKDLVKHLSAANQECLAEEPYGVNDVVDLFQYKCSEYLSIAVVEFDDQELWYLLDLPNRFPIPDVYQL